LRWSGSATSAQNARGVSARAGSPRDRRAHNPDRRKRRGRSSERDLGRPEHGAPRVCERAAAVRAPPPPPPPFAGFGGDRPSGRCARSAVTWSGGAGKHQLAHEGLAHEPWEARRICPFACPTTAPTRAALSHPSTISRATTRRSSRHLVAGIARRLPYRSPSLASCVSRSLPLVFRHPNSNYHGALAVFGSNPSSLHPRADDTGQHTSARMASAIDSEGAAPRSCLTPRHVGSLRTPCSELCWGGT